MPIFGYDVPELLESIKVRCMVPIAQEAFLEEDLLRFANEEMELTMMPNVLSVKEEFYVRDQIISASDVTDNRYEIPYRAIGSKLRNIQYIQGNSAQVMTRIQPEDLPYFDNSYFNSTANAFYLEGNSVVIPSKVSDSSGSVKLSYHLRPNRLVDITRVGIISEIDRVGDGTTGSVTLSNTAFPSNLQAGTVADFLQATPGFKTYTFDVTIQTSNPTTNQVFFLLEDIPSSLKVGDNLATAGECMIPQLPSELHPMLAQAVACRLLEAMGDTDNLQRAMAKLMEMKQSLFTLIDQRTEGNPQKINNVAGILRRSKTGYGRYGSGYGS